MPLFYLLNFAVAFLIAFFLTPHLIRLASRIGIIDHPRSGKIHSRPTPLMGGVSIFIAFLISTGLIFILSRGKMLGEYDTHYLGLLLGGAVIVALGIYDDKKGAKAPVKFLFQTIAALVLVICGYSLGILTNPLGGQIRIGLWGIPLIVLWIVGLTNAVNLIDGLDGLACGVTAIAGLVLFLASYDGPPFVPAIAIALVGSCLGFLRYNFYPARIFLGDTGSLFLGFVLAAVSIQGSFKTTAAMALVLPLVALLVPIADTAGAFFRRLVNKDHPFQADHKHVHHRLLSRGYSQKQVVMMLYLLTINLGVISLVMKYAGRALALGMLFLMGLMLFIFFKIMEDFRLSIKALEEKKNNSPPA